MSIQSEISRIQSNVQDTINVIQSTGVAVPPGANSDNLPGLAAALANEKQDKLTGTPGNFAGLDGNGNLTDSGKKPGDFAAATHSHTGYAEVKIFTNVSVAASAWGNDATYGAYPFAATITAAGVTAEHVPEVNYGATEAASGDFAPVASSGSGTVKIYAAVKPTAAITIPSIICIKAV